MSQKSKNILIIAAMLGMLSVIIGAFGAHAFKAVLLETGRLETFETAVKYQFYHTLAILGTGIISARWPHKYFNFAAYCLFAGVLIFSGSLYLLCATNMGLFGAITPIGGLLLILGWIFLLIGIIKIPEKN